MKTSSKHLLGGAMQLAAGLLKLGQWFRAVSPAVIHGMLAGIGALIFASQFHIMIDDLPKGSGLENLLSLPAAVWKGLLEDDSTPMNHHLAARIGVLTIGTMVFWNLFLPKRFHVMPAVLMGVSVATAVSVFLDIPIQRIEVQDNLLAIIHVPSFQSLTHLFDTEILAEALGLAPEDRALIAAELLASLGPDEPGDQDREAAWIAEIERRARAAIAGSPAVDWPEARARILDRLSNT